MPPHEWHEVKAGWLNVLLPFKAWVGFGIDIRNHDLSRTSRERSSISNGCCMPLATRRPAAATVRQFGRLASSAHQFSTTVIGASTDSVRLRLRYMRNR